MGSLPINISTAVDLFSYLSSIVPSLKMETLNYLRDEEVDGLSLSELNEKSLIKHLPQINFGQRKALLKIIDSINQNVNDYKLKDATEELLDDIELNNLRSMSSMQLSQHFECYDCLKPETIVYLLEEELDGDSFVSLDHDSLMLNFPKLNFGQRTSLVRLKTLRVNSNKSTASTLSDTLSDKELGVSPLCPFVNEAGAIQESQNKIMYDVAPCFSASFLKSKIPAKKTVLQTSRKFSPDDVEATDIFPILDNSMEGQTVIEFVRNNKFIDMKHQRKLLAAICDHHMAGKKSPAKYYPSTETKTALAKGIVQLFPELKDIIGDCPWASWLSVVQTKFESVRSSKNVTVNKKRKLDGSSSTSTCATSSSTSKRTSGASTSAINASTVASSASCQEQEPGNIDTCSGSDESQNTSCGSFLPNAQNKKLIQMALESSYTKRRKWILDEKPSFTSVLLQFKHLGSYAGEMISDEFSRVELLHEDATDKFIRSAPFIIKYAKLRHPSLHSDVSQKFHSDCVQALIMIPKLLKVSLNKNIASEAELLHIKRCKHLLEGMPSSSFLQIAPEGTDVENYKSTEAVADPEGPTYPYLLWITNDMQRGMVYLKVDKECLLLSHGMDDSYLMKAFDVLFKTHYVFMLNYHPFLKTTLYDYFDFLFGLKSPSSSIARFTTAIRQVAC